jgi:hypothetical protein
MARRSTVKSGTFFLRQYVTTNGATFTESSLDISSFVNVLQGEVLRVKKAWSEWTSDNGQTINGTDVAASGATAGASAMGQVTTQSRTGIINITNNDCMVKDQIYAHVDATANIDMIAPTASLNPVDYDDGYLVATDSLYFGVDQSTVDGFANNISYSVLLECEIVRMSLSDAQAVLVSQTLA